ncbi:hypothetical protein [Chitinophaga caseinilytica]|uniref:Phosphate-selective porin O/P n=1 Tax=Chitinophaga caseinilytica TaxID=2267521 RepID=A0ABZ2Z8J7_9BACT
MRTIVRTGFLALFLSTAAFSAKAQFLMDMIDTTTELGKGMISIYKRYDHLRISGYMQPQFQYASHKGIESYSGGDFNKQSDNRFMLRRGRVRFDYAHFNKRDLPTVQFVFQFDGTERGVNIRDFWGRLFDGQWDVMALTMGMFARPFGYEVNLSSGDREAPERGRMSQILMRSERDMGGMLTFEPRAKSHPLHFLKVDVGLFNGQGLSGPSDFDSHKDLIARVAMKPRPVNSAGWLLSFGGSILYGGMEQFTNKIYTMEGGRKTSPWIRAPIMWALSPPGNISAAMRNSWSPTAKGAAVRSSVRNTSAAPKPPQRWIPKRPERSPWRNPVPSRPCTSGRSTAPISRSSSTSAAPNTNS